MMQRKKSGFTLIELLVVIGIIALLASILTPQLIKARESANRIKCLANIKAIGQSMHMFANENEDIYPVAESVPGVPDLDVSKSFGLLYSPKFFNDLKVFTCPNSKALPPGVPIAGTTQLISAPGGAKGAGNQEISYAIVVNTNALGVKRRPYTTDNGQNVLLMEDPTIGTPMVFDNSDAHATDGCNVYLINGSANFWRVPHAPTATMATFGSGTASSTVALPAAGPAVSNLPVNVWDDMAEHMIIAADLVKQA